MIYCFQDIPPKIGSGGKADILARLFRAGYPVPDGFVILPSAFIGDELSPAAWQQVREAIARLKESDDTMLAVRSSALHEDSRCVSFAGQYETVLNVQTLKEIREAIQYVYGSRQQARISAYNRALGGEQSQQMAVIVQRMVQADLSGVMFTVDPVTGSYEFMVGNEIEGRAERLVGGETNASTFTFHRPDGEYDGPPELRKFAARIYHLGERLETELGGPQDIEWAIADEKSSCCKAARLPPCMGITSKPANGMTA